MSRKNRFAPPGYWLYINQRGHDKQRVFLTDADQEYFVALMAKRSEERAVRIGAYCSMSNHFHLVAVGDQPDAVSRFTMDLNGLYATRHTGRVDSTRLCWTPPIGLPTSHRTYAARSVSARLIH